PELASKSRPLKSFDCRPPTRPLEPASSGGLGLLLWMMITATLVARLPFIALQTITLISGLPFITKRAISVRRYALFQFFNLQFDFLFSFLLHLFHLPSAMNLLPKRSQQRDRTRDHRCGCETKVSDLQNSFGQSAT